MLTLAAGEVQVRYRVTDAMTEADIRTAAALLSPDEQTRFARFRFDRDRRDYAAAHALLRRSLSCYADVPPTAWSFREGTHGKPALTPDAGRPPLAFNLSHTHGLVACAITAGTDVGIDVESIDRTVDDGIAPRFFSARENAELRRCGSPALRARRFVDFWTLKEAYIKAIGDGLSHPLDTIVFSVSDDEVATFSPPAGVDAAAWCFRLFTPTGQHRLAIAARVPPHGAVSMALSPGE